MILSLAVGPAADTGPELGVGDGVAGAVVRFDADDDAVADEDLEQTTTAAVVGGTARPDHALFGGGLRGFDEGMARVAPAETGGKAFRGGSRRTDEGAPTQEAPPAHGRGLDLFLEGRTFHARLISEKWGRFCFSKPVFVIETQTAPASIESEGISRPGSLGRSGGPSARSGPFMMSS